MQFKAKIQDRTILFFFTQLISIVGVYYTARIKGICNSLFGSFEDQFVWAMNFAHLSFSKIRHALFTFSPYFSLCVFFSFLCHCLEFLTVTIHLLPKQNPLRSTDVFPSPGMKPRLRCYR